MLRKIAKNFIKLGANIMSNKRYEIIDGLKVAKDIVADVVGDSTTTIGGNSISDITGNSTSDITGNLAATVTGTATIDATAALTLLSAASITMSAPTIALNGATTVTGVTALVGNTAITGTMLNNGVNTGSTHTHPQGNDGGGDSQVNVGVPQ